MENDKMEYDLDRFRLAQNEDYELALSEIKAGRKRSHWIWYIFPQLKRLGKSAMAEYYGLQDLDEAKAYLSDPVLGKRLIEISNALLTLDSSDPGSVMGCPDDIKLCSCMTLFAEADPNEPVFRKVLDKFYGGRRDEHTLNLLKDH